MSGIYHDPFWLDNPEQNGWRPPVAKVRELVYTFRRLVESHKRIATMLQDTEADLDTMITYALTILDTRGIPRSDEPMPTLRTMGEGR